jgi:Fe-S-cluster containining protein
MVLEQEALKDDRRLLAVVDVACAEAVRRSGDRLACRIGCTECCIGPFPITALDAARLRDGLEQLASRDAERAERIRSRAVESAARLQPDFPSDARAPAVLADDELARDAFFAENGAEPCPVLDPETGACELYAHRPLSCRTFGPPMRLEGQALPPCRLCFEGSSRGDIEAARVALDCHALEAAPTVRAEQAAGFPPSGETLIALALASP